MAEKNCRACVAAGMRRGARTDGTRPSADDRSTGPTFKESELLSEMGTRARELEMQYMDELKFLEDSDRDTCVAETGSTIDPN